TTGASDGKQAEGAGADDCYALRGSGLGETERVPGDRGWLDDRGIAYIEARWYRDEARCRRSELLDHPAVGGDAERSLPMCRAQVVRTSQTLVALQAAVDSLDDHRRAVGSHAGELVAEDGAAPEIDIAQI